MRGERSRQHSIPPGGGRVFWRRRGWHPLLLATLLFVGCGYHSTIPSPPSTLPSVAVPLMDNMTLRPLADRIVTDALIDRLRQGGYRVNPPSSADLVVKGVVDSLSLGTSAYSIRDEPVLSRVEATVTIAILRRGDPPPLATERFSESIHFPYRPGHADRLLGEDAAIREVADRISLRVLRMIPRETP